MTTLSKHTKRWGAAAAGASLGAPVALVVLAGPAAAVPAGVYDAAFLAGQGTSGATVEGPAADAFLDDPFGVDVGPDGAVYIVNESDYSVYRVDSAGQLTRFAGTGTRAPYSSLYAPASGTATTLPLYDPRDIDFGPDGSAYIADGEADRVIRISPDGTAATFAGSDDDSSSTFPGYSTPVLASDADLNQVRSVAVDSVGNVYISNQYSHRVDRVTPDGMLTTWVGYGSTNAPSIEGPGTTVPLDDPKGLAVDAEDNLYIADFDRDRVHRVTPAGESTFFAGDGQSPSTFADGPATSTSVAEPQSVDVNEFGDVIIGTYRDVVFYVDTTGHLSRVAGGPWSTTYTGPALDAFFDEIDGVAFGPRGVIYVAGTQRDSVWKLTPAPVVPGAPTGVTVDAVGDGTVTLSWTAPAFTGYDELTGYVVTPYLDGVAQTPIVFDSTDTTQVLTGLVNGGEYTFEVAASNSAGEGPPADQSLVGSPEAPVVEPDQVADPAPVTPAPAGPVLAATGASVALPIGLGAVLLLAGGGALALGRRRRA